MATHTFLQENYEMAQTIQVFNSMEAKVMAQEIPSELNSTVKKGLFLFQKEMAK